MALTTELLKGNAATAGLTDEQVSAIVEMSRNDENTVIGQKTGEIYGGLDTDILNASGIGKNGTEKTYEYAKRVIGEIKTKADKVDALNSQVESLTKEKARLEKVVADGGSDAEVRKELTKAKADLANVTKDYTDLKAKFDGQEDKHAKEIFGLKLDGEFAKATAGLKLKADLPQAVASVIMAQAVEKVKGMSPEYIDDGNGGKVLAFMENGAVMRNKENNLNPYTAAELVARELQEMGVLDVGRKQTGTGIVKTGPKQTGGTFDLSGATSQTQAHDIIVRALQSAGKKIGTREFDAEVRKAWADNAEFIKTLPLK